LIAHLHGTLSLLRPDRVIIDCGGVGYLVTIAEATAAVLPQVGDRIRMPVYLSVSEHGMVLYGFSNDDEKNLFEMLLQVSGVGPKVAQNIVTATRSERLVTAVAMGDEGALTDIKGVGKKLAQRIIVELSGKVGQQSWAVAAQEPGTAATAEAVEALTGLGFTMAEARRAARIAAAEVGPDGTVEAILKVALRAINEG